MWHVELFYEGCRVKVVERPIWSPPGEFTFLKDIVCEMVNADQDNVSFHPGTRTPIMPRPYFLRQ